MIITGIFLFLLGTKLGQAATKTSVKYEGPNKITVNEEKDDQIVLPGLGSPPFAASFFHQGSNFIFNPQFMVPGGFVPLGIERAIPLLQPLNDVTIVTPEVISDKITEREVLIVPEPPLIEVEKIIETLQQEKIEIDRTPLELPEPDTPIQVLAEELCEDVEITNVPMLVEPLKPSSELFMPEVNVRVNKIPPPPVLIVPEPPLIEIEKTIETLQQENIEIVRIPVEIPQPKPIQALPEELCEDVEITNVPMLVEPLQHSSELFLPEINVRVSKIPPPPELPPLNLSEIPKPVFVQEKKVVLIPSMPEIAPFYSPYTIADKKRLIPTDCVQNIIMERFLPNIAFENGNIVEMISIPATKKAPVVSSNKYDIYK